MLAAEVSQANIGIALTTKTGTYLAGSALLDRCAIGKLEIESAAALGTCWQLVQLRAHHPRRKRHSELRELAST